MQTGEAGRGTSMERPRVRQWQRLCVQSCALLAALPALATDSTSASYTSRAGHVSTGGSGALVAPHFSASGSTGQSEAIGPSGSSNTLRTQAGGFWPIVVGSFPALDQDGDGRQAFLDLDDDNDGLADAFETNTGVFVSSTDTGTNPNDADSDDDGFVDGAEVVAGTDPNDVGAHPQIPSLPPPGAVALVLALLAAAARPLRALRGEAR
jgi:hypothetical protein